MTANKHYSAMFAGGRKQREISNPEIPTKVFDLSLFSTVPQADASCRVFI